MINDRCASKEDGLSMKKNIDLLTLINYIK